MKIGLLVIRFWGDKRTRKEKRGLYCSHGRAAQEIQAPSKGTKVWTGFLLNYNWEEFGAGWRGCVYVRLGGLLVYARLGTGDLLLGQGKEIRWVVHCVPFAVSDHYYDGLANFTWVGAHHSHFLVVRVRRVPMWLLPAEQGHCNKGYDESQGNE